METQSVKQITVLLRDGDLLRSARKIFGYEMIEEAYRTTYSFSENLRDDIESIESRLESETVKANDNEIIYDGRNIVIEFKNGHKVMFTNSEWATISLLKAKEYVEYVERKHLPSYFVTS